MSELPANQSPVVTEEPVTDPSRAVTENSVFPGVGGVTDAAKPLTPAERQARHRAKLRAEREHAPVGQPPSREEQIAEVQKQLAACTPGSKQAAAFTRQLALLTKQVKSYARTVAEREQPPIEPPMQVAQPLWFRRALLVESVANRFLEPYDSLPDPYDVLRQAELTPEEIEAGAALNFTPERLLSFVRERIWDESHSNELTLLKNSEAEDFGATEELRRLASDANVNHPGHWIAVLKLNPRVTITAGPLLGADERKDVEDYRAKVAMNREQVRRTLYERYPDRSLGGYRTCEEYDATHPGESILKHNFYPKMPYQYYQS